MVPSPLSTEMKPGRIFDGAQDTKDPASQGGEPRLRRDPAAFDAMWVTWYLHAFTSGDPFRRRCIDLKTLAMQLLGGGYTNAAKRNMPPSWFSRRRHSHVAVQDAIEQGETLRQHRRGAPGGAAGAVWGPSSVVRRTPGCRAC